MVKNMKESVIKQVLALQSKSTAELKELWRIVSLILMRRLILKPILSQGWLIACKSLLMALWLKSQQSSSII